MVTPTRATNLGKKWKHGNQITLTNLATRKQLRVKNSGVDGSGGHGQWVKFWVERTGPERVKLRGVASNLYLRIDGGYRLDACSGGGPQCEFYIIKHGKKNGQPVYSLESVRHPGCHVGFRNDGGIKPPQDTKHGSHGSFTVAVNQWAV